MTLIVLGNDLDPPEVTRALGMFPDQAWRKGDFPEVRTPDGRMIKHRRPAQWGGWKKFMPTTLDRETLEVQLEHWANELRSSQGTISVLIERGWSVSLDCFLSVSEFTLIELDAALLAKLVAAGSDVDIHVYSDEISASEE